MAQINDRHEKLEYLGETLRKTIEEAGVDLDSEEAEEIASELNFELPEPATEVNPELITKVEEYFEEDRRREDDEDGEDGEGEEE